MISDTSNFIEDTLLAVRIPEATKPRHADRQSFEDTGSLCPGREKKNWSEDAKPGSWRLAYKRCPKG